MPPAVEPQGAHGSMTRMTVDRAMGCAILERGLLTSVVVGTALTLINRADALLAGHLDESMVWQIPLTIACPLHVSIISGIGVAGSQGSHLARGREAVRGSSVG
jgi:hypothetical protein